MFAAVLTTLLFSLSAIFGRRVSQRLSGTQANLGRLILAAIILGFWSHLIGAGIHVRAFPFLLASGCAGFGISDLAMFQAYQRIGMRRTVVLIQCLAAPFGTTVEWLWLATAPTLGQAVYSAVILAGVGLALFPEKNEEPSNARLRTGISFGILGAAGQAGGAVLSRKAYAVAAAAGEAFHPVLSDGISAAYQRILGGIACSLCLLVYLRLRRKPIDSALTDWQKGWPWLVAHALAGDRKSVV